MRLIVSVTSGSAVDQVAESLAVAAASRVAARCTRQREGRGRMPTIRSLVFGAAWTVWERG